MDVLAAVKPRRVLEGSSPHSWGRQLVSVQFFMGPSRKRKGHALLSRLEPAAAIQFCISQFAFISCPLSVAGFSGPERNLRVFLAAPRRAFQADHFLRGSMS